MFLTKELEDAYNNFSNTIYNRGVLDAKIAQLVALSASLMADCVPCITHHYKAAVEAGATPQELAEVSAIVMSLCAGSKKAKYAPLIMELDKQINPK
jgi:AhpD family alkylhydroperoxidase